MEVTKALRQLPHDQQVALVLVDMLEYPVAEVADLLGVAQGTVKSRCARGRARLLPRLAHLREAEGSLLPSGLPASRGDPGGGQAAEGRPDLANRAFGEPSAESEPGPRNRFPPGSVLPAQKGGEDET